MKLSTRTPSVFILLGVLSLALGARMFFVFTAEEPELVRFEGERVVVAGTVADDPDRREASVRVMMAVEEVDGREYRGRVLAVLPRGTELQYGDYVAVSGRVEAPESFVTDTGREFDYAGYLAARGISHLVPLAELEESQEGGWSVLRTLYAVKHRLEEALEKVVREPHASLMEGLLLGEKSGLSKELTQAFVVAGLIHIVVLSGYNIGIVAEWTLRALAFVLPRRPALVVAGIAIAAFALLAGGGMATLRATAMGVIALVARYLNRPAAALRALLFAVLLLVLWNPLVLIDVGFVLSVGATFGLITLSPWVEKYLQWLPAGGIRSTAATTIAVQLYVLPALLYFTGVLSLVSVPINVAVLPLVPFAMLMGFVTALLALVHPYLALLPALISEWTLGLIIFAAQWSASLPLAAAVVPAFPTWVAVAVYVPLTILAISKYRRSASPAPTNSSS